VTLKALSSFKAPTDQADAQLQLGTLRDSLQVHHPGPRLRKQDAGGFFGLNRLKLFVTDLSSGNKTHIFKWNQRLHSSIGEWDCFQ